MSHGVYIYQRDKYNLLIVNELGNHHFAAIYFSSVDFKKLYFICINKNWILSKKVF